MPRGLLIITSAPGRQFFLADILSAWRFGLHPFFLLVRSPRLWRRGRREHWSLSKTFIPILPPWLFFICLPFLWPAFGFVFLIRLWFLRPTTVLLVHWPEKILFSPLARVFGAQLVWLEYPEFNNNFSPLLSWLYRRLARRASLIVFSQADAKRFSSLVAADKLTVILPATNIKIEEQTTLFKTLANKAERGRFVVGSVLYGLPKDQAERLLSALAIAQSVCPFIELVIIGEGRNRRQIQWLIKRMGLERRVWLAGSAADFARWLSHLNLYVMAATRPTLEDASFSLAALAAGLPIIAPDLPWLQDIISQKEGALIKITDPEEIAHQFISWQQSLDRHKNAAQAARQKAEILSFEKMMERLTNIIFKES